MQCTVCVWEKSLHSASTSFHCYKMLHRHDFLLHSIWWCFEFNRTSSEEREEKEHNWKEISFIWRAFETQKKSETHVLLLKIGAVEEKGMLILCPSLPTLPPSLFHDFKGKIHFLNDSIYKVYAPFFNIT